MKQWTSGPQADLEEWFQRCFKWFQRWSFPLDQAQHPEPHIFLSKNIQNDKWSFKAAERAPARPCDPEALEGAEIQGDQTYISFPGQHLLVAKDPQPVRKFSSSQTQFSSLKKVDIVHARSQFAYLGWDATLGFLTFKLDYHCPFFPQHSVKTWFSPTHALWESYTKWSQLMKELTQWNKICFLMLQDLPFLLMGSVSWWS